MKSFVEVLNKEAIIPEHILNSVLYNCESTKRGIEMKLERQSIIDKLIDMFHYINENYPNSTEFSINSEDFGSKIEEKGLDIEEEGIVVKYKDKFGNVAKKRFGKDNSINIRYVKDGKVVRIHINPNQDNIFKSAYTHICLEYSGKSNNLKGYKTDYMSSTINEDLFTKLKDMYLSYDRGVSSSWDIREDVLDIIGKYKNQLWDSSILR